MANSKALTSALLLCVLLWAVCSAAPERDLDVSLTTLSHDDFFLMTIRPVPFSLLRTFVSTVINARVQALTDSNTASINM